MKPAIIVKGTKKIGRIWTIGWIPLTRLPKSAPKELPRRVFHKLNSPNSRSMVQVCSMCRK